MSGRCFPRREHVAVRLTRPAVAVLLRTVPVVIEPVDEQLTQLRIPLLASKDRDAYLQAINASCSALPIYQSEIVIEDNFTEIRE
jgi:hypothetical protein